MTTLGRGINNEVEFLGRNRCMELVDWLHSHQPQQTVCGTIKQPD